MKTFKAYIAEAKPNAKPKAKGEADFVAQHDVEITDPEDQEKEGSANISTKERQGKRKADRLDNKQAMGEEFELTEEELLALEQKDLPAKQGMQKTLRQMKKSMNEADFSKQQTKMAHTIGKEFEKKGVGDESKGGPYAVASAMVRDRPQAAKKAYDTIKSKMKEETDAEILFKLYDDLNEDNQAVFMEQLEVDAEGLLEFAKTITEQ